MDKEESRWNSNYDFIYDIQPIVYHYHHGVLAGSYPGNRETTEVCFDDVCGFLGHVCLCGAGGYRVSQIAIDLMKDNDEILDKCEFTLISSKDHSVGDVIAYVLGCRKRSNPEKSSHFIDQSIKAPIREYHYYIGYAPTKKAVHVAYRKHLLIGNEQMDRLWKVELAYEEDEPPPNCGHIEKIELTSIRRCVYVQEASSV